MAALAAVGVVQQRLGAHGDAAGAAHLRHGGHPRLDVLRRRRRRQMRSRMPLGSLPRAAVPRGVAVFVITASVWSAAACSTRTWSTRSRHPDPTGPRRATAPDPEHHPQPPRRRPRPPPPRRPKPDDRPRRLPRRHATPNQVPMSTPLHAALIATDSPFGPTINVTRHSHVAVEVEAQETGYPRASPTSRVQIIERDSRRLLARVPVRQRSCRERSPLPTA